MSWGEQGTFHGENKVHFMERTRYISWGEQGTFSPWYVPCSPHEMYLVLPMICTLFSPWNVPCSPHDMYLVLSMKCTMFSPWNVPYIIQTPDQPLCSYSLMLVFNREAANINIIIFSWLGQGSKPQFTA
jgi:hypothetical protein